MKILKYHEKWMKTGKLHDYGLCNSLPKSLRYEFRTIFNPDRNQYKELLDKDLSAVYWGSGLGIDEPRKQQEYTELRQTFMLLFAALKGEL